MQPERDSRRHYNVVFPRHSYCNWRGGGCFPLQMWTTWWPPRRARLTSGLRWPRSKRRHSPSSVLFAPGFLWMLRHPCCRITSMWRNVIFGPLSWICSGPCSFISTLLVDSFRESLICLLSAFWCFSFVWSSYLPSFYLFRADLGIFCIF